MYVSKDHTFAVCAYQESEFLEDCICSLENQTVKSNIILCTATPNDHIARIAEKHHLEVCVNTGAHGIAEDWNFGFSQAQTPLVTLAHQDDVYEPEYTEAVLDAANRSQDTLILFTDYFEVRNGQKVYSNTNLKIKKLLLLPLRIKSLQTSKWVRRRCLSLGDPICCPAVTYVKEKFQGDPFEPHFRCNLDWQLWEKLSRKRGGFRYISRPLMGHRIHVESTTSEIIGGGEGRAAEDYEMLCAFWPKPLAKLINKAYVYAQYGNEV